MRKKALALLMAGVMMMGCFPATANAANTWDQAWSYNVASVTGITQARSKENSSSVYIRVDVAPGGYVRARAEGYMPIGDAGSLMWINKTWNTTSVVAGIGKWRIRQTIYEDGGRSARLKISKYAAGGTASGVWSPDCAGSYSYLN